MVGTGQAKRDQVLQKMGQKRKREEEEGEEEKEEEKGEGSVAKKARHLTQYTVPV